ncbi:DUF2345 domain-containing protein [Moraxella bovis]|nr:DUF2345 domain-containing protein [Moraxella bovis]
MSLTAKQNIHITTDNNLAITTNKDLSLATTSKYNLTVQNGIRVFVQTGGIKHYTAKDDIELQAQDGQIKHIAKDNIEIISTEGKIQITSPTQLSINICGSEFKMNEQGVFITTPGVFQVKSNEKVMEGGERVISRQVCLPDNLPMKNGYHVAMKILDNNTEKAFISKDYRIHSEEGVLILKGSANSDGLTAIYRQDSDEAIYAYVGDEGQGWSIIHIVSDEEE